MDEWIRSIADLAVEQRAKGEKALLPLGFEFELMKAASDPRREFRIANRPQVPFQPVLLTVDPVCAFATQLVNICIGNRYQNIGANDVMPCTIFCPAMWTKPEIMMEAIGRFSFDLVPVAVDIQLIVRWEPNPVLDPLTEVAYEKLGIPRPTHFRAILWGHHGEHPQMMMEPSYPPSYPTAPPSRIDKRPSLEQVRSIVRKR